MPVEKTGIFYVCPMPKKIAVNTRLLLPGRVEGISRFAYEVLKRMAERNPEVEFHFYFDRAYDPAHVFSSNVCPHVLPPPSRHPILWYTWFHLMLPLSFRSVKPDLFFSPEFYLTPSSRIPQVSVIHDLAYEHYPQDLRPFASAYTRYFSPIYAKKANHILTVSQFSKEDIQARYAIEPEKISVVYNGVSEQFHAQDEGKQQALRDRFTDGKPFFHFVGTLHPRKNITTLLRAFDQFKSEVDSPVQLLLVGRKGWKYRSAFEIYEGMKHKDQVKFSGFVPDEVLSEIYASSLALVYIPNLEGFGIPVLEAMKSESAVICSHSTSLPEVVGEAALQVDPQDEVAVSQAMKKIWLDEGLRHSLIQKGKERLKLFSWDHTYEACWKVLSSYL